ncbi:two-on-two hemoglobin-3 isoform X1 [Zea mays]|uniref:two-on-two hemoglobin-3 isoform X1 n=1 Tax=Zea mays TaxID=4577 RepID=UPI001652BF13|nr:uncharacterized protein LOC100284790 isoform X1 [Zea mays]
MQSLQDKASEWSGVAAADAFAIDDVNIFEYLGGTPQPFVDLSTNFYTRVYEDEEEWFREIFGGSKKEDAIQNQYEFLIQRMGGPPLFSQRRDGLPKMIEETSIFMTPCPYRTTPTILGYPPSCRAVATPHATSFGRN